MTPRLRDLAIIATAAFSLPACAPGDGGEEAGSQGMAAATLVYGPADGHDLPAADLGRVAVGDVAPDFTLESLRDGTITLSSFRGEREVVLVFYRGHW